jgi:maleylpyruvate isomerase
LATIAGVAAKFSPTQIMRGHWRARTGSLSLGRAMKLYGFWRSTATWRVRIGLHAKRLAFDYQPVSLTSGEQHGDEFRRINPMRQVPVLELDDGTRLSQSMAILHFLDETFRDPPLLPESPLLRARVRQLSELVVSGIQPLQNTGVQRYLADQLHVDEKPFVRHWVERGLDALEPLTAASAGRFSVGDSLTMADLCLIPQLYFARRFDVDLARYPTLLRIEATCQVLDPFVRAHAEAQIDAP